MATVNVPNTFSPNTTISSSEVNSNFSTIYNEFNGSIDSANLAANAVATAKIADSAVTSAKLDTTSVTTAKLADSSVTGEKLGTGVGFSAYTSTGQSIPTQEFTKLNNDTEEWDDGGNFASGTFTAPYDGVYTFIVHAGNNSTGRQLNLIYINGTEAARGDLAGADNNQKAGFAKQFRLDASDTVEHYFWANTSGALRSGSVSTWFQGKLDYRI